MVAQGGSDWAAEKAFGSKFQSLKYFAMETLPWACRIKEYGHIVEVLGTKEIVDLSSTPTHTSNDMCDLMANLIQIYNTDGVTQWPVLNPIPNMLSLTLMNINSVWHPCILYGRFKDWNGARTYAGPLLFYEGVDDYTCHVLDTVSKEVLVLRDTIQLRHPEVNLEGVRHVEEWMRRSYQTEIKDPSSLRTCIRTNIGYQGLVHPMVEMGRAGQCIPDTQHRYRLTFFY